MRTQWYKKEKQNMRTGPALVVMAVFTSPLVAIEATAAQSPAAAPHVVAAEKCSESSHTGRRACFGQLVGESMLSVKKAEGDALAKIARWFENERYHNVARTKMRAAGASYARYREARCAYLDALNGNERGTTRLTCLAQKNL